MSFRKGVYYELRESRTPLAERIQLCSKVFTNDEIFVPNKYQVLCDWLCSILQNLRSLQGEREEDGDKLSESRKQRIEIWKLLLQVLQKTDTESEFILIKERFLPVLFEELSTLNQNFQHLDKTDELTIQEDCISGGVTVFSCCIELLRNTEMCLFSTLVNIEQCLKYSLSCFLTLCNHSLSNGSHSLIQKCCELVNLALQEYGSIQRQQVSQRKVLTSLCEKLLRHLLLTRYTIEITNSCWSALNMVETVTEITSKLDSVLTTGLFDEDHILNYRFLIVIEKSASEEPSAKKQRVSTYSEIFFQVLRSVDEDTKESDNEDAAWRKSVLKSLPFLLESFLENTKDERKFDRTFKFNFFVKLYNIASEVDSSNVRSALDVSNISVMNEMLQILLDYDVYQIGEDNTNGRPMFDWFVKATEKLLKSQENILIFKCLDTLLQLNHKIVENCFELVLQLCLTKYDVESVNVEGGKLIFFYHVIETYSKLQQVEYLVKSMFEAMKSLAENVGPIPACILTKLSQVFEQFPLTLTITLFTTFVDELKSIVGSLQPTEDVNCGPMLEAVTTLFVIFLTSSSYDASDQHGVNQGKVSSLKALLTDTKALIMEPLMEAFIHSNTSYQAEVGFSMLYLLYGLNEVVRYLRCHNVFTSDDLMLPQMVWDHVCGTFVPDQSWASVRELLTTNLPIKCCIEMLVAQKARYLMTSQTLDEAEITCCVNFLYDPEHLNTNHAKRTSTWNGNIASVTSENYQVAHWYLLANYAPLFIPYCSTGQGNAFAKYFLQTLVHHDQQSLQDHATLMGSQISKKLLDAGELCTIPAAQDAIVGVFWTLVGKSVKKIAQGRFPTLENILSWKRSDEDESETLDENSEENVKEEIESGNMEENEMMDVHLGDEDKSVSGLHKVPLLTQDFLAKDLAEVMKNTAHEMNESLQDEDKKKVKKRHIQDMEKLLSTLMDLHCSSFTSHNQTRCLLGLMACDVVLQACVVGDVCASLKCRQALVTLLQELLQSCDFAAWKVVDLESLLLWLRTTMASEDLESFSQETTNPDQPNLPEISNTLLQVVITIAVRSRKKANLKAISSFHEQLLTSIPNKITSKTGKNIELLYSVLLACTKLLNQMLCNKPSVLMLTKLIKDSVRCLVDQIATFLKNKVGPKKKVKRNEKSHLVVFKLIGVLTKAVGLITKSDDAESEWGVENRFQDWGEVVVLAFHEIVAKLENHCASPVHEQIVAWVDILEEICQCTRQHCQLFPDDFQSKVYDIGLRILSGQFPSPEDSEGSEYGKNEIGNCGIVGEVVLRLFSTVLNVNDGENCATLLEHLVNVSFKKNPILKPVTCLSIFNELLSNKMVKKRRKDLRARLSHILAPVLCYAAIFPDILTLVVDVIASVLSLGSNAFFPQDIGSFAFKALVWVHDIKVDKMCHFSRLFTARFTILSLTLFYYRDYAYGIIHLLLACASDLLKSLLTATAKEFSPVLPNCAQKMSRLYQELASHKRVFSKYVTYFLENCIHLLSTLGIPGLIKQTIIEGVYSLLAICDDDTLARVHLYLPSRDRELFRAILEGFNKHHKFKGNA